MLGLLGGLQHFGNDEIRPARRIIKVAKNGTAMGAFCGVIVAVGFNLKAGRQHNWGLNESELYGVDTGIETKQMLKICT